MFVYINSLVAGPGVSALPSHLLQMLESFRRHVYAFYPPIPAHIPPNPGSATTVAGEFCSRLLRIKADQTTINVGCP